MSDIGPSAMRAAVLAALRSQGGGAQLTSGEVRMLVAQQHPEPRRSSLRSARGSVVRATLDELVNAGQVTRKRVPAPPERRLPGFDVIAVYELVAP